MLVPKAAENKKLKNQKGQKISPAARLGAKRLKRIAKQTIEKGVYIAEHKLTNANKFQKVIKAYPKV